MPLFALRLNTFFPLSLSLSLSKPIRQNKRPTITMPPNLQEVKLKFPRRRTAKVMGELADREDEPNEGEDVKGIMVTHNFSSKIVSANDLATYTPLRVGSVSSKLHVPYSAPVKTFQIFINEMFMGVSMTEGEEGVDGHHATVFGLNEDQIKVTIGKSRGTAIVEWEASPANDVIADATVALLMQAQSSIASIRMTSKPCRHWRAEDDDTEKDGKKDSDDHGDAKDSNKRIKDDQTSESRLRLIRDALKDQFNLVESVFDGNTGTYEITTDCGLEAGAVGEDGVLTCTVNVEFEDNRGGRAEISVECPDKKLAQNVNECLQNLAKAAAPIQL